jgi:hypothetical protein
MRFFFSVLDDEHVLDLMLRLIWHWVLAIQTLSIHGYSWSSHNVLSSPGLTLRAKKSICNLSCVVELWSIWLELPFNDMIAGDAAWWPRIWHYRAGYACHSCLQPFWTWSPEEHAKVGCFTSPIRPCPFVAVSMLIYIEFKPQNSPGITAHSFVTEILLS